VVPGYDACMEDLDLAGALAQVRRLVGRANKYIEETAPWTLHKVGDPRLGTLCRELLEALRVATLLMAPVIPRAAAKVAADLGINLDGSAGEQARGWNLLRTGDPVKVGDILFPRLDRAAVLGGD
jgi:methionyl-tRNA synthetase